MRFEPQITSCRLWILSGHPLRRYHTNFVRGFSRHAADRPNIGLCLRVPEGLSLQTALRGPRCDGNASGERLPWSTCQLQESLCSASIDALQATYCDGGVLFPPPSFIYVYQCVCFPGDSCWWMDCTKTSVFIVGLARS